MPYTLGSPVLVNGAISSYGKYASSQTTFPTTTEITTIKNRRNGTQEDQKDHRRYQLALGACHEIWQRCVVREIP